MHSLYTNEVTDCLKPTVISVAFIHQHLKKSLPFGRVSRVEGYMSRVRVICRGSKNAKNNKSIIK